MSGTNQNLVPGDTLYVETTYLSQYGETLPSPEASIVVSATGAVSIASPAAQANATGYNVYAALVSGGETKQNVTAVPIGTAFVIDALTTGAAVPTANSSGSPWATYALAQAAALVIAALPGVDYTLASYNCAAHILLKISPDLPGVTYFSEMRGSGPGGFNLNSINSGLVTAASDQGTSDSLVVPDFAKRLTLVDLDFMRTPWGREFTAYNQSFGNITGLT